MPENFDTAVVSAGTCGRCGGRIAGAPALPAVGLHADTLSPLCPNGRLVDPDDDHFTIAAVCPSCDLIITLLSAELDIHHADLTTYFKVLFPHGRYDLITASTAAAPTPPSD
jgi:hypothetical protein